MGVWESPLYLWCHRRRPQTIAGIELRPQAGLDQFVSELQTLSYQPETVFCDSVRKSDGGDRAPGFLQFVTALSGGSLWTSSNLCLMGFPSVR